MGVKKYFFLQILFFTNFATAQVPGACETALSSTKRICIGTKIVTQMLALIQAVEINKSSGNIRQSCESAAQLSRISFAGNLAYAETCGNSARHCKKACGDSSGLAVCEYYERNANLARIQSVMSALHFAKSRTCAEVSSDKYEKPQNQNNFLAFNGSGHEAIESTPTNTQVSFRDTFQRDYDFEGEKFNDLKTQAKVEQPSSGAIFNPGSETSHTLDTEPIMEKERIDKEILKPSSVSSVSTNLLTGTWESKGGTMEVKDEDYSFNWKDYLPNGIKSPSRSVSSGAYIDSTITPANGLTNFQKVTRKMNEKRSELMP